MPNLTKTRRVNREISATSRLHPVALKDMGASSSFSGDPFGDFPIDFNPWFDEEIIEPIRKSGLSGVAKGIPKRSQCSRIASWEILTILICCFGILFAPSYNIVAALPCIQPEIP